MARDPIEGRFDRRQSRKKLDDLSKRARGHDDVAGEEELLENTDKVEPLKADEAPGRNDPCPCGSGKKYKKCCWGK